MSNRTRDRNYEGAASFMRRAFEEQVKEVYTAMPGVVLAYDPETRCASVRGAIDILTTDGERIQRPELRDVPVVFPSSAGFSLLFPLAEGDDVLLLFSMRGLQDWKDDGAYAVPDEVSLFSEHDAIAIPGLWPGSRDDDPDVRIVASADEVDIIADRLLHNGTPIEVGGFASLATRTGNIPAGIAVTLTIPDWETQGELYFDINDARYRILVRLGLTPVESVVRGTSISGMTRTLTQSCWWRATPPATGDDWEFLVQREFPNAASQLRAFGR